MAIQKDLVLDNGLTVPGAYCKVTAVSIVSGEPTGVRLSVYTDSEKASNVQDRCYQFDYDIDGENAITQAYNHIKQMPEFLGSVDC